MEPLIKPEDIVVAGMDGSPRDGDLVVINVEGQVLARTCDNAAKLFRADGGSVPVPFDQVAAVVPVVGWFKSAKRGQSRQ